MNKKIEQGYLFISLWLASMVSVYAQYQLNVYGQEIMESFHLTATEYSALFTAPMLPAILLSFFTGKLSDVAGSRKVIGGCLLITSIGAAGRYVADSYGGMMLCMMLTGFGAFSVTVNAAKILGNIFHAKKLSLAMGFYITGSMLAQTLATATSAVFFSSMKKAFLAAAIFSGIITVFWLSGLFLFPEKKAVKHEMKQTSFREVIQNSGVWITGLCLMITFGVTVTLNSFLPVALMSTGKYTQVQAGTVTSMISMGNLLGAIIGPILYRKLKSLRAFLTLTGIASAIGCIFGWRLEKVELLMIAMLCTGIFLGSSMPVYFSMPVSLQGVSSQNVSTASGLTTTMQLAGAVIIPTYVLAPIAKNNFGLMFIMAGIFMLIIPILSIILNRRTPL